MSEQFGSVFYFFFFFSLRLVLLHWSKRNWVGGEDNRNRSPPRLQGVATGMQDSTSDTRMAKQVRGTSQGLQWVAFRGSWFLTNKSCMWGLKVSKMLFCSTFVLYYITWCTVRYLLIKDWWKYSRKAEFPFILTVVNCTAITFQQPWRCTVNAIILMQSILTHVCSFMVMIWLLLYVLRTRTPGILRNTEKPTICLRRPHQTSNLPGKAPNV